MEEAGQNRKGKHQRILREGGESVQALGAQRENAFEGLRAGSERRVGGGTGGWESEKDVEKAERPERRNQDD